MTEEKKNFDRLSFARIGEEIVVDFEGFVSTSRIRVYKDGAVSSFGVPLENVQKTIAAMFPQDFIADDLPETNWLNVTMFDNKGDMLSTRLGADIDGKKRIRIRVTGTVSLNTFEGKKSIDVRALDYYILWDKTMKGTKIGGRNEGPSYFYGKKIEDGTAQVAIQGYVNNPKLSPMSDGRKVLSFGLAVEKRTADINQLLGTSFNDETVWVNVAVYDSETYPFAQKSAQVIRQGAAIAGLGYAKRDEFNGKEQVRFTLDSFNVLKYAKFEEPTEKEEVQELVTVGAGESVDDSPFDNNFDFDLLDDEHPF